MTKDDPASLSPEQEQLRAARYASWRAEVSSRLNDAGRWSESVNFAWCGSMLGNFQVQVCDNDVTHEARAIPFTCHLRYCPDCERRHQAELVVKYTPVLKAISEQDDRAGWSLKKIVLTTPYALDAPNAAEQYADAWDMFERWQQITMQYLLRHELTDGEKRRGRVDYKQHGYGSLVSAEFGENGRKLHFHLAAYMPFLEKHKSSELWQEATGGEAEITWIARIDYHAVEDAVREQVKYVTKFQELPPELVVKLADVLDGARRVRTYGTVRAAEKIEKEPHVCSVCSSKLAIMLVTEYFQLIISRNVEPDAVVLAAGEHFYLEFKRGNKVGDAGGKLARSDPDASMQPRELPGFDAVFTPKKPFQYQ